MASFPNIHNSKHLDFQISDCQLRFKKIQAFNGIE
jgi:hypothetical protein